MAMLDPNGSLEVQITDILRTKAPAVYCDECLALTLRVSRAQAHRAAIRLAQEGIFRRTVHLCSRCARAVELTCSR